MEYFQFSQEEALEVLGVDPRRGLSRGEVQRRRAKYGKNQLETAKRRGVLRQFLGQFQDLMVLILLAAAAVSFGVSWVRGDGEYVDLWWSTPSSAPCRSAGRTKPSRP